MRILIYVDPVIYRHDGMALAPHANFARCLINANWRSDIEYAFASSPWLIEEYDSLCNQHGGHRDIRRYPLNPARMLARFDYDNTAYSLDQFASDYSNSNLVRALEAIRADFAPDIVICSTQTTYAPHIFDNSLVVWHDLSHILRKDGTYNLFLDGCGHQYTSVLNCAKSDILALEPDPATVTAILERHDAEVFSTPDALSQRQAFREWRRQSGLSETKLALIALQHNQLITVEGAYGGRHADQVLMQTLETLPTGWKAVVSYHPEDRSLIHLEPYIGRCFDNWVQMPPHILGKRSDVLIPELDGIITVSSKIGLIGLLAGRKVISLGRSAYYDWCLHDVTAIDSASPLLPEEIAKLLQFMSNRYYFTFEEWFQCNHYMLTIFEGMKQAPSPRAYQLDTTEWTIQSLNRLFGS